MKFLSVIFVLSIFLCFSACEKTEKVEDFPAHTSKLVVNCFFNPDTPFIFNLSKSLSPLDNAPFKVMNSPSAYIRVYENNVLFDSFRVNSNGNFTGNAAKLPKRNTMYRFDCYYPGFGVVKAEDYLPDSFKLGKIKGFNTIKRSYDYNYNTFDSSKYISHTSEISIDLESANLNGDYLFVEISFFSQDTFWGGRYSYAYIYPEEITGRYDVTSLSNKLYIANDGQKINNLKIKWDYEGQYKKGVIKNNYIITVYSCSKSAYEYLRRSALQVENQDDPFAQPSPVSNNIINGFGVFGGVTMQTFKIAF